jgi:hypothetical protein
MDLLEKQLESGTIDLIFSDPEWTVDIDMGKDMSYARTTNSLTLPVGSQSIPKM